MNGNEEAKIFDGQVAGHGNIVVLPNGTLLKLSTETELEFYKLVEDNNIPLGKFMPKCYNYEPGFEQIKGRNYLK